MIRCKIAMGFLCALLTLALHVWPGIVAPAHAQGSRKDDIVFNSRGVPLAGATVRVCAMPATGQPCTPLAQIYSDSGLTQALANPTTTDGLGNYSFYAAPGKYEIEISGPGITTKQLPNIILPNDPSSPTFSSLSSSGAISAFSLNLTGNLTVNGNTSVIGNLASGTLTLTNQGTPPGAASSGTVNLYTKSADKRLYYKDDTGAEQGPLGAGVQANAPNTFTAQQNFDADVRIKGPNPWFDLSRYGGYSAASPPTTTGSIASSSVSLSLANAQDFANGQGIVVYGAGAATSLTTPGTPTVTPTNIVNGSTTYAYKVIAEDRLGGLTAASPAGTTVTGQATLGTQTVTLSSCVRSSGIATYTSTTNHNYQAGTQVQISGFAGTQNCNGVKTIATVPTSTTFTTSDGTAANESLSATGSSVGVACNTLSFLSGAWSGGNTLRYWVYRSVNSGAYSLVGIAQGNDPWFQDCGFAAPSAPSYVPATPPSTTQAGYLETTIASGGGTTTLILADSASTSVSGATVLHDNAKPLLAAMQAAYNEGGGTVYIPATGAAFSAKWPFNGAVNTYTLTPGGSFTVRVHFNSNQVQINQPWILASNLEFDGETHDNTSFQYVAATSVSGSANPMFYFPGDAHSAIYFKRLLVNAGGSQQVGFLSDSYTDGGGNTGVVFDDTTLSASTSSPGLVYKGGFDFFWNRGTCQNPGYGSFNATTCIRFTNASQAVTTSNPSQLPGRIKIDGVFFSGSGITADCMPNNYNSGGGILYLGDVLFESQINPLVRINCSTTGSPFTVNEIDNVATADIVSGFGTPLIDAQNATNNMAFVIARNVTSGAGNPPLLIGPSGQGSNVGLGLLTIGDSFSNPGNLATTTVYSTIISPQVAGTWFDVPMVSPTSAPGLAVGAGGSVPTGTIGYAVQFFDVNGNATAASPIGTVTTSTGNQTVTITQPTPPAGAVTWEAFRNVNCPSCGVAGLLNGIQPVSTTTIVDTNAGTNGNSPVTYPQAGVSTMSANGLSGPGLTLVSPNNHSWATAFPANLTANRIINLPDASGYLEISSYINSAYDNFNRANGALGANWTTPGSGCPGGCVAPQVSGNQLLLPNTSGSAEAFYTGVTFAADQFSQITSTSALGSAGLVLVVRANTSNGNGYYCSFTSTQVIIDIYNGSFTALNTGSLTPAVGDVYRCEARGSTITAYQNGVAVLSTTDTSYTSGSGGIYAYASGYTADNFSAGNLHPLAHLDVEQDWTQTQHFVKGVAMGSETFTASPRSEQNIFLPGALISTWTGATWTLDKAVTITRVQVQAKTAPSGCSTNAVVRLTDGTTPVNVTISGAGNDSGAIAQNYAAGASVTLAVQTAAAGCSTSPADANVAVQYRMQ